MIVIWWHFGIALVTVVLFRLASTGFVPGSSTVASGISKRRGFFSGKSTCAMSNNSNSETTGLLEPSKTSADGNGAVSTSNADVDKDNSNQQPKTINIMSVDTKQATTTVTAGEPGFFRKLLRRIRVFRIALQIFVDYRLAKRSDRKLRKRLGLVDDDDDNNLDHPSVNAVWDDVHSRNAHLLTSRIMSLSGFWVKVGQYLSSRADVMPPVYLRCLAALQDGMPPKPFADIQATLHEQLSVEELALFRSINPTPLATASLAQVHRAVLQDGREVVVKVQHRGVATLMLQDMDNLRLILTVVAYFEPDADFSPVVREYDTEVRRELDFRLEAENMETVRMMLLREKQEVIVPKSILVKERVLVMDYCEGFPVRDIKALDEHHVDRHLLVGRICQAWATQMHVGGVFNADPHMGNILVSTTSTNGDASVPVLLDFGLTKRFDANMRLAFARLMHASEETDVDALLRSFDEMGMKLNRYDPFEDMANMQRGFRDPEPIRELKEAKKKRSEEYRQRQQARQEEEKGIKRRNPVDAWPSELIFYGRVTNMLRGLCSSLDVRYPYLQTMATAARKTLNESVPKEERAESVLHASCRDTDTPLQRKLIEAVETVYNNNNTPMLGLQLCVYSHGKQVANVAAGVLGRANPRPVTPSTLFCVFSVSKAVLTIGVLRLVQDGSIESLDDPVCKYWPAFGKEQVTIRHVLSHQSGLSNVVPEDGVNIDTLLNWEGMKRTVERATPDHVPGGKTQYHYLSFAWLCGGIVEAVTGRPYEEWLQESVVIPSGVEKELYMGGLPSDWTAEDSERDVAVLTVAKQAVSSSSVRKPHENSDGTTPADATAPKKNNRKLLAKYQGQQQLMNPSVFNMDRVRKAKLPSANGHSTATALVRVFDMLVRDEDSSFLTSETLEKARTPQIPSGSSSSSSSSSSNTINSRQQQLLIDAESCFGLGFQLHTVTLPNGKQVRSVGHGGFGGSVVIAIPELKLSIAFVTNMLSSNLAHRNALLKIVLDEYGMSPPSSMVSVKYQV